MHGAHQLLEVSLNCTGHLITHHIHMDLTNVIKCRVSSVRLVAISKSQLHPSHNSINRVVLMVGKARHRIFELISAYRVVKSVWAVQTFKLGGIQWVLLKGKVKNLSMCVCVLASSYRWVTAMHEIPISSAQLLTSLPFHRTQ